MYFRNILLRRGAIVLLLFLLAAPSMKAQNLEIGAQLRSFNFNVDSDLDGNPLDPSDRATSLLGGFYLQQNRDKNYFRYLLELGYSKTTSRSVFSDNSNNIETNSSNGNFLTRIGFEIGKNIELGKRFRLQPGVQWSAGRRWRDRNTLQYVVLDTNRLATGYGDRVISQAPTWELYNLLVLRADFDITPRISLGVAFDWGLGLAYTRGRITETRREFDLSGNQQFEFEFTTTNNDLRVRFTPISRPILNIGFTL